MEFSKHLDELQFIKSIELHKRCTCEICKQEVKLLEDEYEKRFRHLKK
jgi:hypothetical protein